MVSEEATSVQSLLSSPQGFPNNASASRRFAEWYENQRLSLLSVHPLKPCESKLRGQEWELLEAVVSHKCLKLSTNEKVKKKKKKSLQPITTAMPQLETNPVCAALHL